MAKKFRIHYLIDIKFQLKYTFLITLLSVILYFLFYYLISTSIKSNLSSLTNAGIMTAPLAKYMLAAEEGFITGNIARIFLGVLIIVAALTILFTHKIAGPIYRLRQKIKEIANNGISDIGVMQFRKNDEFQDLARDFNIMIDSIKRHAISKETTYKNHINQIVSRLDNIPPEHHNKAITELRNFITKSKEELNFEK